MGADALAEDSIFPDKNLEAAVRKLVFAKKANAEPLTKADVEKISTISARGQKIANLSGLEHCEALASLDLADNAVTDLLAMKGLTNLQSVTLSKNQIKDVVPLAGLTKLQYLELSENQIADVAPLAKLTNLRSLYLSKNQISDIGSLGELIHLWSLYLEGNKVSDIGVLAKIKKLSSLDLKGNGIADITPLSGLTELRYLFLDGNQVSDIGPLVAMAKADAATEKRFAPFWRVYLDDNPLSDTAKTAQLAELKSYGSRVTFGKGEPEATAVAQVPASQADAPGPYHDHFKPLVGDWSVAVQWWAGPGATPIQTEGLATKKLILGGRFLEESFRGESNGETFTVLVLLGYDGAKQQYSGNWVDTRSTGFHLSTGTCDESGKTITMTETLTDAKGNKTGHSRSVIQVINDSKHVVEMHLAGADGKEYKSLEIAYTRTR
jgi:internalin A